MNCKELYSSTNIIYKLKAWSSKLTGEQSLAFNFYQRSQFMRYHSHSFAI